MAVMASGVPMLPSSGRSKMSAATVATPTAAGSSRAVTSSWPTAMKNSVLVKYSNGP